MAQLDLFFPFCLTSQSPQSPIGLQATKHIFIAQLEAYPHRAPHQKPLPGNKLADSVDYVHVSKKKRMPVKHLVLGLAPLYPVIVTIRGFLPSSKLTSQWNFSFYVGTTSSFMVHFPVSYVSLPDCIFLLGSGTLSLYASKQCNDCFILILVFYTCQLFAISLGVSHLTSTSAN